jgi:hypothetical protein
MAGLLPGASPRARPPGRWPGCGKQLVGALHERSGDGTGELCLPAGLVGKGVDDRKRQRIRPECKPGDGLGLGPDERQCIHEERGQVIFLSGFGLEPDDQACGDHLRSSLSPWMSFAESPRTLSGA